MDPEKPLHVRVAEALGCKPVRSTDPIARRNSEERGIWGACWCLDEGYSKGPHANPHGPLPELARYDTDWSATGPMIEKYGISVMVPDEHNPDRKDGPWMAGAGGVHGWDDGSVCMSHQTSGSTPLLAVCRLILALKAAGKLEA